jgi:hypothetical protein
MASGHVNRANRPNTWPLRPVCCTREKSLASPEPCRLAQCNKFVSNLRYTGRQINVRVTASRRAAQRQRTDPTEPQPTRQPVKSSVHRY